MASIFSKIVSGEIPSFKIHEDENFLAFLDVFPLVEGHVLVIPKKETDYLFDLEDSEYQNLFLFAKNISKAIEKAVPCRRIGMAVIGLEVPHAHIHLVPMQTVRDINFEMPKLHPSKESLTEMAERIKSFL